MAFETIAAGPLEEGRVLRVLLNQPKGNVLTSAMMREIASALAAAREDRRLKLVLIRGAGGHFSFGASVEEHRVDSVAGMLGAFHALLRDIAAFPVPVAALVEGRCLGGGFEMALCCHLVLAAPTAIFACPEIKLGVFPPVLAAVGPRRLGSALAERLLLTGDTIDAAAAARAGFATVLTDAVSDPESAALDWYRTHLAPLSAAALRHAVRASRRASGVIEALGAPLDALERQYLDEAAVSLDGREGIDAFIARRAPVWQDA